MPENIDDASSESLDLDKYWRILCRRRWWLALPAFGIWALVWTASWFLPAVYRSETVILVEQQKVPEQYVVSNIATDLQERLQSMTQQILSRTRLLKIIEELNLYPNSRGRLSTDQLVEQMRKDIQIDVVQSPDRRRPEVTGFKVAYVSDTASLAQQVTSQLTSLFISENLRARQEQSQQTTQFLDSQLEDARRNLTDQESKVKEFKSQYLGQLPEQVQSNVQILSGIQARLQQEMDALSRAKQQAVYLESLLTQWRTLEADLNAGRATAGMSPPAIDQELARLRAQLADLSSHYTDRHPDVRKLREQIVKTERMKEDMQKQVAVASQSSTQSESTLRPSSYADLQAMSPKIQVESQIKSNKVEIDNRQRSIHDLQSQIEEYQARLNMTPVREQQLAGITRDYEQSRKNYEELLAKRDQSEMATNLEKRQEGEQFRVLDPPNLPQKPDSPDRLKLNFIGLAVGFVGGMASVAGLEILDDRLYSKEELGKITTAPILTEIPPLPTPVEVKLQRRSSILQLVLLGLMFVCTGVGFTTTYLFG